MKSKTAGIIIFICIIFAALTVAVLSIVTMKSSSSSASAGKINANEYIAHIHISGVIQSENRDYNQKWLLDTIQRLRDDKKNIGIILSINSPGGTVYESDEVYLALRDYAESGKEVCAYLEQLAASGGYYIACGADYIAANRNTLTGSIGVIAGQSVDLTGLMERYGIKITTITAGKNKNMGNIDSPLTPEQRAIMQSLADECYEQFIGIVAEARNMPVRDVRPLADGRVYTAKQALRARLIDEIGTYDDVLAGFKDNFLKENPERKISTVEFNYMRRRSFGSFIESRLKLIPGAHIAEMIPAIGKITYPAYLYVQ